MRILSDATKVQIRTMIDNTIDFDPDENAIIFFSSWRLQRLGVLLGRHRVVDSISKLFDREADYWFNQAYDGGPRATQCEMYKCFIAMRLVQILSATGRLLELVVVTTVYIPLNFYAASIGYLTAILAAVQVVLLTIHNVNPTLADARVYVCVASTSWIVTTRAPNTALNPPGPNAGLRQNAACALESPLATCRRTETKRGVA